jgi:hypothetical protein
MNLRYIQFLASAFTLAAVGCTNESTPTSAPVQMPAQEKHCYLLLENQDSIFVELSIIGEEITGIMNYIPFEKDAARGTVIGQKHTNGECKLQYKYILEGMMQTEEKWVKIESNKLLIKEGEMIDPSESGRLVYKDANAASYSLQLPEVPCK